MSTVTTFWRTVGGEFAYDRRLDWDLATRDLVQAHFVERGTDRTSVGATPTSGSMARSWTSYAPGIHPEDLLWVDLAEVRWQGETLRVGEARADLVERMRENALDPAYATRAASFEASSVATEGACGPAACVVLRTHTRTSYWGEGARGAATRDDVVETTFSADAPYPVRVAWRAWVNDTAESRASTGTWSLVALEPGREPVPWAPTRAAPRYASGNAALEHTPARHPEDGSGVALPYPLRDALAAVDADPTLATLRALRLARSDTTLAGFWYDATGPATWWLSFGAPQQDVVLVVQTTRANGASVNREVGLLQLPPRLRFDESDLAAGHVTLASAMRLNATLAGATSVEPPRAVTWGLHGPDATNLPAGTAAQELRSLALFGWNLAGLPTSADTFHRMDLDARSGALHDWGGKAGPLLDAPIPTATRGGAPVAPTTARPGALTAGAAAGVGLGVAALVAYFWPLLRFALAGFTRLHRESVLDHHLRETIVAIVRAAPGITPPRIQAATRAGWSTIVYHLRVLEREGVLATRLDGRHKRCFVVGQFEAGLLPALAILGNEGTRAVYELIQRAPGVTRQDVADAFGYSGPAAHYHLRRLQKAGLVQKAGPRRKAGWVATGAHAT